MFRIVSVLPAYVSWPVWSLSPCLLSAREPVEPQEMQHLLCRSRINFEPSCVAQQAVLRIRVQLHRIHVFLGLPDPLVRDTDPAPDPSIIKQK